MKRTILMIAAIAVLASAGSAVAGNYGNNIDIHIPDPTPHVEAPHLDDPPSKNVGGGVVLTPELVDALDVGGGGDPGPAEPALPGGILEVDDTPQIVILDDGVGSNPGGPSPDGKSAPGALVIRLACAFSPDGLVIRNLGDTDAPMGLRLKWQARGLKLAGVVQLDQTLRIGQAARLGGVAANGADCGIKLVS